LSGSEYALPSGSDFLDQIEDMARQHCFTDKEVRRYHGVAEVNVTDSGATSANADALRTLAKHGRFRIVREYGRMVVGYWPENDPNRAKARKTKEKK
jgi:homogentisate 1,2-dioxygenase